jgi:predicted small secreted protein
MKPTPWHALWLLLAAFALNACNTIEGVGKDIKKGGEVIERAADRSK